MKKFLFILVGMFLLQTTYVAAQEMTKEERKLLKWKQKRQREKRKKKQRK